MGINKLQRKISNKLQPVEKTVNKIVQNAPQILAKTSSVLGKTSNVLDKIGSVSGKILTNPATAGFIASTVPELLPAYGAAIGASALISKAGAGAGKASALAQKGSNVLEKVQPQSAKPAITFA